MPTRSILERTHAAALGLWLGALTMMGVGAPLVFITLRKLNPTLPDYAAYTGRHDLIAGGHIVKRLFAVCDVVQGVALVIAAFTFLIAWPRTSAGALRWARLICLALVAAVLMYRFFVLDPALTPLLASYWSEAAAGRSDQALAIKARYDAGHALENKLFATAAALVLGALLAAIVSPARAAEARS